MNATSQPKASGNAIKGATFYAELFVDGDRVEVYVEAWSGNVRPWRGQVYVNGAPTFVPQGFSTSPSRAGESVLRRYMAQRTITCKCGSTFGYAAGKYGCPNCNGDAVGGESK